MENTNKKQQNQQQNQNVKNGKDENKMVENNSNKVVQLNETQEVVQEIKNVRTAAVNSNEYDLEIAKAIVAGTVDTTKLRTTTDLEKAKLEQEATLKLKEVEERLEMRRMELKTKQAIWDKGMETAFWVGISGAVAATSIMNTRSNNEVKIKRMEQGILD